MARMVVIYRTPKDPAAFDAHYFEVHVPLAKKLPGLRKYVINVVETRVFAALNISVVGQSTLSEDNENGELLDLRYADPRLAIRTIERNRDVILGVKVRLSRNIAGDHDLAALRLAREAADAVRLPVMAHIGSTHSPLKDILALLSKGDVITHSFHGRENGILDGRGRPLSLPADPGARIRLQRGWMEEMGLPSLTPK